MASTKVKDFSKVPDQQLELIAQCFQALSDPTRLKVLKALKAGEKSVQELVEMFGCSQPNISRHLAILTASGLVTKVKKGSYVLYSVANPGILQLCDHVCSHVQGVIQRYSARPSS